MAQKWVEETIRGGEEEGEGGGRGEISTKNENFFQCHLRFGRTRLSSVQNVKLSNTRIEKYHRVQLENMMITIKGHIDAERTTEKPP